MSAISTRIKEALTDPERLHDQRLDIIGSRSVRYPRGVRRLTDAAAHILNLTPRHDSVAMVSMLSPLERIRMAERGEG